MRFFFFQLTHTTSLIINYFSPFRRNYAGEKLSLFGLKIIEDEKNELGGRIIHRTRMIWRWAPWFDMMILKNLNSKFTVFSNDPLEMIVAVEYSAWIEKNVGIPFDREKFITYVSKKFSKDHDQVFDAAFFGISDMINAKDSENEKKGKSEQAA